jgi:hypothetical protein
MIIVPDKYCFNSDPCRDILGLIHSFVKGPSRINGSSSQSGHQTCVGQGTKMLTEGFFVYSMRQHFAAHGNCSIASGHAASGMSLKQA